jgi:hypothetical protein
MSVNREFDNMENTNKPTFLKFSTLAVEINPEVNKLLTEAAERSKRTRRQELIVRLEDHLRNFGDIAAVGKRFQSK